MQNKNMIEDLDKLNLKTIRHLALQIGISEKELRVIANDIGSHYWSRKEVTIRDDGAKKVREIYRTKPRLERILKAIDKKLLKRLRMPMSVHGGRKDHSNSTNAAIHVNKKVLYKFDIKDFYPSITHKRVYNLFQTQLGCSPDVAGLLTRLCTADSHLPQGFNTSPYIANLVLLSAINRIVALCRKQGLTLTTYIDDLTISGNKNPSVLHKTIAKILNECGFNIQSDKIEHLPKHKRQKVTGLVVNRKVNISKDYNEQLRERLLNCKKNGPAILLGKILNSKGKTINSVDKLQGHLFGKINHVKHINPTKGAKLVSLFNSIEWNIL